jgi:hypothetical protein
MGITGADESDLQACIVRHLNMQLAWLCGLSQEGPSSPQYKQALPIAEGCMVLSKTTQGLLRTRSKTMCPQKGSLCLANVCEHNLRDQQD